MRATEFLDADEAESAKPPPDDSQFVTVNGDGVLDRLNEAAEWEDILVHGAQWETAKPQDRETLKAFKRPGGTYDISAKVLKINPHVLVVHSDAAGLPYGAKQKNTKGRVYAHLHYGSDLSAAARALARGEAVNLPAHVIDACKAPPRNPFEGLYNGPRSAYEPPDPDPEPPDDGLPDDDPYQDPPEPDYAAVFAEDVEREVRKIKIREQARARVDVERRGPLPPFDAGTLRDMLARPRPPRARVDSLIPWEASTLIPAQRKTGKTTLLLNLARSLLAGEPFLGTFEVQPVDGLVALLNYEVSGDTITQWADEAGLDPDRFYIVNLRGRRNPLADPEDRGRFAELLRQRGTESLLVDPFGRAYTGQSQNDSGEVGGWLAELDRFTRNEVGARDLILTTHAGWKQERTRGASALEDWADSIITMIKDDSEDGDGDRYLRAIGRDVDLEEDQVSYDPDRRTLTLVGSGSRKAAKDTRRNDKLAKAVLDVVTAEPGLNTTQIGEKVRAAGVSHQRGDIGHAATRLVEARHLRMEPGANNAKNYYPTENLFDDEKTD